MGVKNPLNDHYAALFLSFGRAPKNGHLMSIHIYLEQNRPLNVSRVCQAMLPRLLDADKSGQPPIDGKVSE